MCSAIFQCSHYLIWNQIRVWEFQWEEKIETLESTHNLIYKVYSNQIAPIYWMHVSAVILKTIQKGELWMAWFYEWGNSDGRDGKEKE